MVGGEQMGRLGGLWRSRLRLFWRRGRPLELWLLSFRHPTVGAVALRPCTGSHTSAGGVTEVVGLLFLLWVLRLRVVLLEADVPGQAADGRHGLELVDHVPRDEVNVVVTELDADIADAFPPQLVELGVVHPLDALWGGRKVIHLAAPPSDT